MVLVDVDDITVVVIVVVGGAAATLAVVLTGYLLCTFFRLIA